MASKRSREAATDPKFRPFTSGRFTAGPTRYLSDLPIGVREQIAAFEGESESECATLTHEGRGCRRALSFTGIGGTQRPCLQYCTRFLTQEMERILSYPIYLPETKNPDQVLRGLILPEPYQPIGTFYILVDCDHPAHRLGSAQLTYDSAVWWAVQSPTNLLAFMHDLYLKDNLAEILKCIQAQVVKGQGIELQIILEFEELVQDCEPIPETLHSLSGVLQQQMDLFDFRIEGFTLDPRVPPNVRLVTNMRPGETHIGVGYIFIYRFCPRLPVTSR